MGTAHTPGPWKYDGEDYIRDANGIALAQLSHSLQLSLATAQANYKIMAASTELLEALQTILPHAEIMINSNHPDHKKAIDAIKKATE